MHSLHDGCCYGRYIISIAYMMGVATGVILYV